MDEGSDFPSCGACKLRHPPLELYIAHVNSLTLINVSSLWRGKGQ